ncbi:hypothetical protein PsorP6_001385 [Peronosclerospora sorghi]|uniref:Uncharacterized protein n=1 Tax=Peronosclerospora sorghi TaxID=230839 RepID=A0ACC0WRU4_9STRA|nr:hypothetical protein PsorP6_001385 [Peronosclerospora sorghi]
MSKDALVTILAREMDRIARNAENWQERMAALGEMQRAFEQLKNDSSTRTVTNSLSTDVWKILRPLKDMVQDLRSQIVKEVCSLLTTISRVTRDAMAPFLREMLPTLVEVRGGGNKVCGTYCSECLEAIVTQTVVKGATLRLLVDILLESKNKLIRLCCISCLYRALNTWSSVLDKNDVQQIEKGLQHALYDASSSCRAQAHELFLAFQTLFPKRAVVVMSIVDYKIQKRLEVLVSSGESSKDADTASIASVDEYVTPRPQVKALAGFNIDLGDRVCIAEKELFGIVRYLGEITGVKGMWVGIELDEAHGKNDGSVKGRYYFRCKPKHGVFTRPHQVFVTMSGSKVQQVAPNGDTYARIRADSAVEHGEKTNFTEAPAKEETLEQQGSNTPAGPVPPSSLELPSPNEPSKLSVVLNQASLAHRRYLNCLLVHIRAELEEHERFQNCGTTASSADAVQYLQQLQNSAQQKIVLSDEFIQQIIYAQQEARES